MPLVTIILLWAFCFSCTNDRNISDIQWKRCSDGLLISVGNDSIGTLTTIHDDAVRSSLSVEAISAQVIKVTTRFKAVKDIDSTRICIDFHYPEACHFWMIPSISYNGNHWGRGKEAKGASMDGEWYTWSYRRTPIPGITFSEGKCYAVAMWSDNPQNDDRAFSCSLMPDSTSTTHRIIWPEEEQPRSYIDRDVFSDGFRRAVALHKGENVEIPIYLCLSASGSQSHYAFLDAAWEQFKEEPVEVPCADTLWSRTADYFKHDLWREIEPADGKPGYKGFTMGLWGNGPEAGFRLSGPLEAGWCGQNISISNSLLTDYLKNGNQESLEKGMTTLDTWVNAVLNDDGLFAAHFEDILRDGDCRVDACNLGTAAYQYFESFDLAAKCGFDRPRYREVALGICHFALTHQGDDGCYAKAWNRNGDCLYREGTIGCFLVPPMLRAYEVTGDDTYLQSALRAFRFYYSELLTNRYTTAGALDTWCIDKESAMPVLRSALALYRITNDRQYLDAAVHTSYYLSTWLWHYDGIYPDDDFSQYGYHTFGGTWVSVQHHHIDNYACCMVPEWLELARLTGDEQWKEKAIAIWHNANQLVSDGTLTVHGKLRPRGSQNEAYFPSRWGFGGGSSYRINSWLVAWPGAFRMETIRRTDELQ